MIGRRTFLKWGTATPIFLSRQAIASSDTRPPENTIVVVDGFDRTTEADQVSIVLEAFARKGLPVTCLLELNPTSQNSGSPSRALFELVRDRLEAAPGLVQAAPVVPQLGAMTPYFQARAAHDAQKALQNALWGDDNIPPHVVSSHTIACDMLEEPIAPSGVRASGIRNILMRPRVSAPVRPEAWEDGILRLIGGQRVALQDTPTISIFSRNQPVERVLYLSARDFATLPLARIEPLASAFAERILRKPSMTWASPILASDLQFRDSYAFNRNVALHFVIGPETSEQDRETLDGFRLELTQEGLPSSFGPRTSSEAGSGYWIELENGDPLSEVATYKLSNEEISIDGAAFDGITYGIAVALSARGSVGLNADNILNLPTIHIQNGRFIHGSLEARLGTGDCVIAIPAELALSRAHRSALKQSLRAIQHDGISNITSLTDYVRHLVPTGPYITHFRRTQAFHQNLAREPQVPRDDELDELMADAEVAWSYFERWTNPNTGLCPATANFEAGQRELHEAVTMWDVGSHIFALIAAVDLELISPKKFQSSIRRILPNIAGRRSQGRLLPQGWIATDKFKWGIKDFDGCDAGRLLAALYNLDMHPLAAGVSAATVAAWDLNDIVQDGIIYSVEDGALTSTYRSHCAHYAAWAFRTWGIEVRSPYEVLSGRSDSDGRMALLEVGGRIGPMGAEPLLMEAIEFGMSAESAYLADVLFAAQLEEYAETGKLVCVSEGPINNPPWFLYQGLQFDASGREWATDTVAGLEAHRTKAFRDMNLSISSKGAYLWSAYRDHPFCDRLRSVVRNKARTPYGFASSINQATGVASSAYSDINTNAVILQAIAHKVKAHS